MARDRWLDVEVEEVVKTTDKAALCVIDDEEHWIPFSQIEEPDAFEEGDASVSMRITRWFAEQEGL